MTAVSVRKLAANRANARASTGPRTAAGKARSARNAVRHGLCSKAWGDPEVGRAIERWGRRLAGEDTGEARELAYRIAAAQVQLERVREARLKLYNADPRIARAAAVGAPVPFEFMEADDIDTVVELLCDTVWQLDALQRYDESAYARRQRTIRQLEDLRTGTITKPPRLPRPRGLRLPRWRLPDPFSRVIKFAGLPRWAWWRPDPLDEQYVLSLMMVTMIVFLAVNYPTVNLVGTSREIAEKLFQRYLAKIILQYPESANELPDVSKISWTIFAMLVLFPIAVLTLFFNRASVIGADFYSAFLSPFRACFRLLSALTGIPVQFTTYFVRRKGWSVLLKIAMGLEGYRYPIPLVGQFPHHIPKAFVTYEDMPKAAQQRAMDKRSAWITRHLGDISQTFAKMAIAAADISSLLHTIEQDQSLVHAAYYTDDECIARIADWIAAPEPM